MTEVGKLEDEDDRSNRTAVRQSAARQIMLTPTPAFLTRIRLLILPSIGIMLAHIMYDIYTIATTPHYPSFYTIQL